MRVAADLLIKALLLIAVIFYARYVFARLGHPSGTTNSWMTLRGKKLILYILSIALAVFLLIPALAVLSVYLVGIDGCPISLEPTDPWRCSGNGRLFFALIAMVVILPLAALWMRTVNKAFLRSP